MFMEWTDTRMEGQIHRNREIQMEWVVKNKSPWSSKIQMDL